MNFVPQTEVQGQVAADLVVVLHIGRNHTGALSPGAGADASAKLVRQSQEKVGFAGSRSAARGGQGIGTGRVPAREVHQPDGSVVSRVISVDSLAHELEAGVNNVLAHIDHQAVLGLNHRIGKQLLDSRVTEAAHKPAAETQGQQAWAAIVAIGDTQVLGDVAGAAVKDVAVVQLHVIRAQPHS